MEVAPGWVGICSCSCILLHKPVTAPGGGSGTLHLPGAQTEGRCVQEGRTADVQQQGAGAPLVTRGSRLYMAALDWTRLD